MFGVQSINKSSLRPLMPIKLSRSVERRAMEDLRGIDPRTAFIIASLSSSVPGIKYVYSLTYCIVSIRSDSLQFLERLHVSDVIQHIKLKV